MVGQTLMISMNRCQLMPIHTRAYVFAQSLLSLMPEVHRRMSPARAASTAIRCQSYITCSSRTHDPLLLRVFIYSKCRGSAASRWGCPLIPVVQTQGRTSKLMAKQERLESRQDQILKKLEAGERAEVEFEQVREALDRFPLLWKEATLEERKELMAC